MRELTHLELINFATQSTKRTRFPVMREWTRVIKWPKREGRWEQTRIPTRFATGMKTDTHTDKWKRLLSLLNILISPSHSFYTHKHTAKTSIDLQTRTFIYITFSSVRKHNPIKKQLGTRIFQNLKNSSMTQCQNSFISKLLLWNSVYEKYPFH